MDAVSVARAQAALALSVSYYQDETVSELLVERERLAMEAEDLRSFVAGRHFTHNLFNRQGLPPSHLPRTWQRAYEPLFSDWLNRHDVIHEALRDLRMGDPESAERLLKHEVGKFSDNEENDEHLRE